MVEKYGTIKNPLTVIAIFAAIAEISGTTVLPFISSDNQSQYIWFLMLFPAFLVAIFFLTLNFNHKVLYAPSDFKDENIFLKLFAKASPEEQEQKMKEELTEGSNTNLATANKDRLAKRSLAEKLVFNRLSRDLGVTIKSDMIFSYKNNKFMFDGIAETDNTIEAIEIRLFRNEDIAPDRLMRVFTLAEGISEVISQDIGKKFKLIFAAVAETDNINSSLLKENLTRFAARYRIDTEIRLYSLSELQSIFD